MADSRLFAASYDLLTGPLERRGLGERRARLLATARGRVCEVGGGTGANVRHYRPELVERLVVLEPSGPMRDRLAARARGAPVPVEVSDATLEAAPGRFGDGSFDTVVATLVLCTVPDLPAGLGAIRRLLAPGGRLLFLEHVRGVGLTERLQRAVAPAWRRLAGGCRLDRSTTHALREAGFVIDSLERFDPVLGRTRHSVWVQGEAYVGERP